MTHTFSPSVLAEARKHAIQEYPRESCGLVIDGAYLPCENVAPDPLTHFAIADSVYLQALQTGKIEAIFHSHPDGPAFPNELDMTSQLATAVPWGIIVTDGERASDPIMWGETLAVPDLIGRKFIHGVADCYTLIRDYYLLERNVTLPEFPRSDAWWNEGGDLYRSGFQKAGFREIQQSEIQPGDVFLMSIRSKVPNHGGIFYGNNLILHHLPERLSRREPIGIWLRAIDMWLRYEGQG